MLRALAVDDERPSLEELLYLLQADPRVGSAEGAGDAIEALRRINRAGVVVMKANHVARPQTSHIDGFGELHREQSAVTACQAA